MALRLTDRWVWDFWIADTGDAFHCFYLQAPRSLRDPDLRHEHATVGHAASEDLVAWEVLEDALGPGPAGAWDDRAIWTGSVVRDGGIWSMLYTGTSKAEHGAIQRIGMATSSDLRTWTRHPKNPLIEADGRWYEKLDPDGWPHEAWRDPWVFADETGTGWHALITARGNRGPTRRRGVIGHAQSSDLVSWTVRPPLAWPRRFHHLEVPQVTRIEDRWYLLFSVDHARGGRTYACAAASPLGPYDIGGATVLGTTLHYSGRVVVARDGQARLVAFRNTRKDGTFIGELSDPIALRVDRRGRLATSGLGRNRAGNPATDPTAVR